MSTFRYSGPARITRRVSVGPDRTVTVNDTLGPWFVSELHKVNSLFRRVGSPRTQTPLFFRHRLGVFAPSGVDLRPGDRVGIKEDTYEITTYGRSMADGRVPQTVEFQVVPVDNLYPLTGHIQDQAGTDESEVVCSIYTPSEDHGSTGTYENSQAEAPLEYASDLHQNKQLQVGSDTYKIVSASINYDNGFVLMNVRRTDASR